jgi:hypothetical protein
MVETLPQGEPRYVKHIMYKLNTAGCMTGHFI